jgi:two-component system, NarL family, sensor histidine kinase DesK
MTSRVNWWPMIFAVPIVYLPIHHARFGSGGWVAWAVIGLAVIAYVALFAVAISSWQRTRSFLRVIPALALLGLGVAPFDFVGFFFFDTAACMAPWAVRGDLRRTVRLVVPLILASLFEGWLARDIPALESWWYFNTPLFMVVMAAGNVWVVQASLAAHRFAKASERDRIARDLHDVLGHTLSLIALKAELAGWLVSKPDGRERAWAEMREVERISKRALAEVHRTIRGSVGETLGAELERASTMLRTAGIVVEFRCDHIEMDAEQERVLCLALREAITNVVRHANAKICRVRLQQEEGAQVLEIQDDGRGGLALEGEGLRGMRERAEARGGSVLREVFGNGDEESADACALSGTRLVVKLPLVGTA